MVKMYDFLRAAHLDVRDARAINGGVHLSVRSWRRGCYNATIPELICVERQRERKKSDQVAYQHPPYDCVRHNESTRSATLSRVSVHQYDDFHQLKNAEYVHRGKAGTATAVTVAARKFYSTIFAAECRQALSISSVLGAIISKMIRAFIASINIIIIYEFRFSISHGHGAQ